MALALADSSIVTLALPDMVQRFDVSITEVAWVLISYNLVLAAVIVPAAHLVRRRPRWLCACGSVLFAAASLACAFSADFLLIVTTLGPAVGGIVTQVAGWEAIFLAQAPVAVLPLFALWRLEVRAVDVPKPGRPHVGANLALLLGSAALSAALFLLVILLVNGWALDPAIAGLVVTVMPVAAVAVGRVAPRLVEGRVVRAAAGFVLIAGGLAALAFLPHVGWIWTIAPQLLIGAGLGLTVTALTEQALAGRAHQAVHGGWTIASRHAGIVVGLLVLTPVFAHELDRNQADATRAGAAIVIESSISPIRKLGVARAVLRTIDEADGRLPDIREAFAPDSGDGGDAAELRRVGGELQDRLERAVTSAFGPPFLIAAALALGALGVVAVTRDVET